MYSTLVLCAACIAVEPPALAVTDAPRDARTFAAYDAARASTSSDADSHVRLALWCEAHGLQPERLKHLAIALLKNREHLTARGLMGLVAYHGRWQSPRAVSEQLKADAAYSATMDEYEARRSRIGNSPGGHWKMALWCEQHELKPQATAHLIRVTQLEPAYEPAWKRLGFKKRRTRWATDEQVAADQAEIQAQERADEIWMARLVPWRSSAEDPARRYELTRMLADVTDPRAVPVVWQILARGTPNQQRVAMRLFDQIDSLGATRALALLAIKTKSDEVRRHVIQKLKGRHIEDVGLFLVTLLRDRVLDPYPDPILYRFQLKPVGWDDIGSPGMLFVRGPRYGIAREYTVDESFPPPPTMPIREMATYVDRVVTQRDRQVSDLADAINQILAESEFDLMLADDHDRRIDRLNDRIIQTLRAATGLDFGKDPEAWRKWWVDEQGYAYQSPPPRPKEDLTVFVDAPTYVDSVHYSCFAAGTPVHTISGLRPIESVEIGDQVLTQDPRTGALGFQPVLAAAHNQPDQLWKITLGEETIKATGIHRFWKVGRGWVMARDLKPGDILRTLGGVADVTGVEPESVQPVFNLDVMEAESFFVGDTGMLVHDNSPVQRVHQPFDAVSERAKQR